MPVFVDQCGHEVVLTKSPERIISLVPSQTELLHDLGVGGTVTGITRYCVHPPRWIDQKHVIGGTKSFDFNLIEAINPDLIIGNKEENYKEGIEALQKRYPVWMSDIYNLSDALMMIEAVGRLVNAETKASALASTIQTGFENLEKVKRNTVLYLIWRKPWMAAASETFIDDMINRVGLINCVADLKRYPVVSSDQIAMLAPDVILLSSEPFPFKEKHVEEVRLLSPRSQILLVDGEMFSWYGSRLLKSPAYFNFLPLAR